MKTIYTPNAPEPIGPYSQGIDIGDLVFLSGQIGLNPKTGILKDGLENQTKQVLENIKSILESINISLDNVIKTTIFLKDLGDFEIMNKIYGEYFFHKPARSTIEISALPKGALIEIEVIAKK